MKEAVLSAIKSECKLLCFHAGDTIVDEGDLCDRLLCLHKGVIKIMAGGEVQRQESSEGMLLGLAGLCNRPESCTVVAASFCDFRFITYESFSQILMSFPEDWKRFRNTLNQQLASHTPAEPQENMRARSIMMSATSSSSAEGVLPMISKRSSLAQSLPEMGALRSSSSSVQEEPSKPKTSNSIRVLDKLLGSRRSPRAEVSQWTFSSEDEMHDCIASSEPVRPVYSSEDLGTILEQAEGYSSLQGSHFVRGVSEGSDMKPLSARRNLKLQALTSPPKGKKLETGPPSDSREHSQSPRSPKPPHLALLERRPERPSLPPAIRSDLSHAPRLSTS